MDAGPRKAGKLLKREHMLGNSEVLLPDAQYTHSGRDPLRSENYKSVVNIIRAFRISSFQLSCLVLCTWPFLTLSSTILSALFKLLEMFHFSQATDFLLADAAMKID